jgi:hypothetical protein
MAIYSLLPPPLSKTPLNWWTSSSQIRGKQESYSRYRYQGTSLLPAATTLATCPDPDFLRELSGSEKFLSEAAAAGKRTAEAKILNVLEFFGPLESNPQELTTVNGTSIWAGDGVHLTSSAARVAARKMMAYVIGGETAEPASKQARLESVIPVRSAVPQAAKTAQPAPPPPPKPVPPPLLLSGQLPANQRGNANPRGQLRGGRGNNPQRGGQQGQTRTVPSRGAPRGGRPGRWGRW